MKAIPFILPRKYKQIEKRHLIKVSFILFQMALQADLFYCKGFLNLY